MRFTAFVSSIPFTQCRTHALSLSPLRRTFYPSNSSFVSFSSFRLQSARQHQANRRAYTVPPATMSYSTQELQEVKFPTSVEFAQNILDAHGVSRLDMLSTLLSHSDGARGFFVSLLTAPPPTAAGVVSDPGFIRVLLSAGSERSGHPRTIRELMVKNVVMPTAMVVSYTAEGNEERAEASRVTRDNAAALVSACIKCEREETGSWVNVDDKVEGVATEMMDGLQNGRGKFAAFLAKWGYSDVQKGEMAKVLQAAIQ